MYGVFQRAYVYLGSQMLTIQQNNQVSWVHQDPVTKSQRITNAFGTITSTIDLDPWGGEPGAAATRPSSPIATQLTKETATAAMKQ